MSTFNIWVLLRLVSFLLTSIICIPIFQGIKQILVMSNKAICNAVSLKREGADSRNTDMEMETHAWGIKSTSINVSTTRRPS